jgi:hypothetical protein
MKIRMHTNFRHRHTRTFWPSDPPASPERLAMAGRLARPAEALQKAHEAQVLNYLKATGYKIGLLVNFTYPHCRQRKMFKPVCVCLWLIQWR